MAFQNFKIRTTITVLGIPTLAAITLFTTWTFAIFFTIAGGLVLREMFDAMRKHDLSPNTVLGYAIYLAMVMIIVGSTLEYLVTLLILSIIGLFIVELFRKEQRVFENLSITFFAVVYTALVMGSFIQTRGLNILGFSGWGNFGGRLMLTIFLAVWICDMLAYLVGSAIGKHKIFPRVSPNKSWEGSVAGLLGAILTVYVLAATPFIPQLGWIDILALGVIAGGFGQVGDFAESLVKRDVGVKDSSNLIPGHGGAWDRLDSLFFAVPLSYLYIKTFFLV